MYRPRRTALWAALTLVLWTCGMALGTETNLALRAAVTASSAGGAAGRAVDDDFSTEWRADGRSGQWLRVDLGGLYSLTRVEQLFADEGVWHFTIEASVDGTAWAVLADCRAGAAGRAFARSVGGTFRYVRLNVLQAPDGADVTSRRFRVFGTDRGENLAAEGSATASTALEHYAASAAIDGRTSTYWAAGDGSVPQSLTVDLGAAAWVGGVEQHFKDFDEYAFTLEASGDAAHWTTLLDHRSGTRGLSFAADANAVYRYVRLNCLGSASNFWAGSTELKVIGYADLTRGRPAERKDGFAVVELESPSVVRRVDGGAQVEISTDGKAWAPWSDAAPALAPARFVRAAGVDRMPAVYGTPVVRKLTTGVSAAASSMAPDHPPTAAADRDSASAWRPADGDASPWLQVDLGVPCVVTRVAQRFSEAGDRRFRIEVSADRTEWITLLDGDAGSDADADGGTAGDSFDLPVEGVYRYVRLTVEAGDPATASLDVYGVGSPRRDRWWESTSGVMRYYMKYYGQTLDQLAGDLPELRGRGFGAVELMAPYAGPPDVWAGLGATDNYAVDPSIGTMADLEAFVAEAHRLGLRVMMFGNVGYARDTAPFFVKAQDDRRDGVESRERDWFHFRDEPAEPAGRWHWSDRAGAYFYGYWGDNIPNYNFASPAWRDEASRYLRFWMDKGFDGFALDAPEVYDGITAEINDAHLTDVLRAYDVWANPEGARGVRFIRDWHYNSIQDYALTDWGGDGFSAILPAIDAGDPDGLEAVLKGNRDAVVAAGGITQGPPSWEIDGVPPEKRLLEVALLTTSGTLFYLHNGRHTLVPQEQIIPLWSPAQQAIIPALMRAQNAWPALAPAGGRAKLPTNDDHRFYAFKRTDLTGGTRALVVLNFQPTAQRVTVDLTHSGLSTAQTPVDLLTGDPAPPIDGDHYSIALPPYGFAVLGVD